MRRYVMTLEKDHIRAHCISNEDS